MIDYELKQKILKLNEQTSVLKLQNDLSRLNYFKVCHHCCPVDLDENYLKYVYDLYFANDHKLWNECAKINQSSYERMRRLRRKIAWMISNFFCSFLTFDFSDETLQLDSKYRRILVQRACNALDTYYIGNIDFGSQDAYVDASGCERLGTAREHYHVIVAKPCDTRSDDSLATFCKKYGHVHVERCRPSGADIHRLAKYTAKLANHAIKETARRSSLLYSRKHQIPKDLPDIFQCPQLPDEPELDPKNVLHELPYTVDFYVQEGILEDKISVVEKSGV